jgi:hypothetical protein
MEEDPEFPLNDAGGHAIHASDDVALCTGLYVPDWHFVHVEEPSKLPYVPAVQFKQNVWDVAPPIGL